jgi:hypothetical protein
MTLRRGLPTLLLAGCFGSAPLPDPGDGGISPAGDLLPPCIGNNDGVITREELIFPVGAALRYLENPPGTTATVAPDGAFGASGVLEWDLTSSAGQALTLTLEPVSAQWFAGSFPGATYATTTDPGSGTLGIFRVTDAALELLGFASPEPDRTLMVYDQPIASLRFPIRAGDAWVTGATIRNGKLDHQPYASADTYRIAVDARGTAVLPFLRFENTLRVHVELSQAVPGGVQVNRIQHLFFHECYGEVGRMVSTPGETDPAFTQAAEFRRLAL